VERSCQFKDLLSTTADLKRQERRVGIISSPVPPKTSNRKDWHSAANRAVLKTFRARRALGILPRRLHGRRFGQLLALLIEVSLLGDVIEIDGRYRLDQRRSRHAGQQSRIRRNAATRLAVCGLGS